MYFNERIHNIKLSSSERIIINYILSHKSRIKFLSTQTIAAETYVSPTLIIRVAKKLGYTGWVDMKTNLLLEIDTLHDLPIDANVPFTKYDNLHQIANNITSLEIETLRETFSLLHSKTLNQAMQILNRYPNIDIYAQSYCILLAEIFEQNMLRTHKTTKVCRLTSDGFYQAFHSNKETCAILLIEDVNSQYIHDIADILYKKKVPIIVIGAIPQYSHLNKFSTVILNTTTKEDNGPKLGNFSLSLSINLILDILYGCIFSNDYQKYLDIDKQFIKIKENALKKAE